MGVLFCTVMIGVSVCRGQQGAGDLFRQANEAYTQGDFERAAPLYESIILKDNIRSPEVMYNMGNTYYRLDRPGKALLWWERALQINPRDQDIRYNILFLKARLFEEKAPSSAVDMMVSRLQKIINLNEIAVICAVIYCCGMIAWMIFIFTHRPFFLRIVCAAGVILGLSISWLGLVYQYQVRSRRAVVMVPTAEVHNGPADDIKVGFTVTEGTLAILLRESGGWREIGIPSRGLKGWVKKNNVEQI